MQRKGGKEAFIKLHREKITFSMKPLFSTNRVCLWKLIKHADEFITFSLNLQLGTEKD